MPSYGCDAVPMWFEIAYRKNGTHRQSNAKVLPEIEFKVSLLGQNTQAEGGFVRISCIIAL